MASQSAHSAQSSGIFDLNTRLKHDNHKTVKEFFEQEAAKALGKKDYSRPLNVLKKHWVNNIGDLRLLMQEQQLRSVGLPLRLCVWIESELVQADGSSMPASMRRLTSFRDLKVDDNDGQQVFVHQSDFDHNGILYWIGTNYGKESWQNPADAKRVMVTTSGLMGDSVPAAAVVGRETVRCVTKAMSNAWFAIDLVDKWVLPTHYTLRHYSSWDTECLRHWVFEGSNDGVTWMVLRSHELDESLKLRGSTCTWSIDGLGDVSGFRMFRVRMTAANSNNHMYLALSGMEIYGRVSTSPVVDDAKSYTPSPAGGKIFSPINVANPLDAFDSHGIIFFLGTRGGSQAFSNPAEMGELIVTASGIMKDSEPPSAIVGNKAVRCVTAPHKSPWFSIDFKNRRVSPTHYSLRHYSTWDTEVIRNWRLEASEEGISFVTLLNHTNDTSMAEKKGAEFRWHIPQQFHNTKFKVFRVVQWGPNSNNHTYLACSGFELHGTLHESSGAVADLDAPVEFKYLSDFDSHGIVHYIATRQRTSPWVNPVDAGYIDVTASSLMHDSHPVSAICGPDVVRCVTKPVANSWFVIDFKDKLICPTHYTLRHYSSWDVEAVRNWLFEGSNDGVTWLPLQKHTADTSLNAKGATHTWVLPEQKSYYRMFRILQFGLNSNNHNYLALSGFEIYGRLKAAPAGMLLGAAGPAGSDIRWDASTASANLRIDNSGKIVTNTGSNDRWQLARTKHSASSGIHRYIVLVRHDPPTSNTWKFIIGVVPSDFGASGKRKEWVGALGSWGYIAGTGGSVHSHAKSIKYGQPFGQNDVIEVVTDFTKRTVSFVRNGVNQGVAFSNLTGPVSLAVSMCGAQSELQIVDADAKDDISAPLSAIPPAWENLAKFMSVVPEIGPSAVMNLGSKDKWQTCNGSMAFTHGRVSFSVKILASPHTSNNWRFIVGVVPVKSAPISWIGSKGSWGYIGGTGGKNYNAGKSFAYGEKYGDENDLIRCVLDFDASTIEFFKNGKSQGIAFDNLAGPVYPAVSITATGAKVQLLP
jgi:SPRY domain/Sad1 / UNC-like C-terminal